MLLDINSPPYGFPLPPSLFDPIIFSAPLRRLIFTEAQRTDAPAGIVLPLEASPFIGSALRLEVLEG